MQGGSIIGAALKDNEVLKALKISENELRTEGCEFIIKNASKLQFIDLSKNYISFRAGDLFKKFLKDNNTIQSLNLEFNELLQQGIEQMSEGIQSNRSLKYLNLKANGIKDEGLQYLSEALYGN